MVATTQPHPAKYCILLMNERAAILERHARKLEEAGFEVATATRASEALELARSRTLHGVIAEHHVKDMSFTDLATGIRELQPRVKITTFGGFSLTDIRAIPKSADRILFQEAPIAWVVEVAHSLVEGYEESAVSAALVAPDKTRPRALARPRRVGQPASLLIGELRDLRYHIGVAAQAKRVLISGPTGSGKELVAKEIHLLSGRREFHSLNCANLNSQTAESELFGHEPGAFTGARQRRIGLFEFAHGGTLFLDEVHTLPEDVQAKLLRALAEGEFRRMGSNQIRLSHPVVITATNVALFTPGAENDFKSDLYFRVRGYPVDVPSLDQHRRDIPLLAEHITREKCAELGRRPLEWEANAMSYLAGLRYPGNVRELQDVVGACVLQSPSSETTIDRARVVAAATHLKARGAAQYLRPISVQVEELRETAVAVVTELEEGDMGAVAKTLGVHRNWPARYLRRSQRRAGRTAIPEPGEEEPTDAEVVDE